MFTIGGFSGLMLAIVPADYQYQDTYFVVAHFHYVLVPGSVFAIMGAVYYWMPKWTGHMYDLRLARWHFWLSAVSGTCCSSRSTSSVSPACRAASDYNTQFTDWNMVSSIGGFAFGLSQLLFVWVVVKCVRGGAPASARSGTRPRPASSGRCRRRARITPSSTFPRFVEAAPVSVPIANSTAAQRRARTRRLALALALVALLFYAGFILLGMLRARG